VRVERSKAAELLTYPVGQVAGQVIEVDLSVFRQKDAPLHTGLSV
jgi:hypothetical protein